jgi:hypothetical protein
MFKNLLTVGLLTASIPVLAGTVPIEGNVESKCIIATDVEGVYGNPTSSKLSTDTNLGGVAPTIRYDIILADSYKARIAWPQSFTSSPSLNDTLNWSGETTVESVSDAGMSSFETNKIEYDNVTEFDLDIAGSVWFKINSEVEYGYNKPFPGGKYVSLVEAECIAK